MSYGQFIDHDLAETPVNRCDDNSAIECCEDIKCPNCDCKHLFFGIVDFECRLGTQTFFLQLDVI